VVDKGERTRDASIHETLYSRQDNIKFTWISSSLYTKPGVKPGHAVLVVPDLSDLFAAYPVPLPPSLLFGDGDASGASARVWAANRHSKLSEATNGDPCLSQGILSGAPAFEIETATQPPALFGHSNVAITKQLEFDTR